MSIDKNMASDGIALASTIIQTLQNLTYRCTAHSYSRRWGPQRSRTHVWWRQINFEMTELVSLDFLSCKPNSKRDVDAAGSG